MQSNSLAGDKQINFFKRSRYTLYLFNLFDICSHSCCIYLILMYLCWLAVRCCCCCCCLHIISIQSGYIKRHLLITGETCESRGSNSIVVMLFQWRPRNWIELCTRIWKKESTSVTMNWIEHVLLCSWMINMLNSCRCEILQNIIFTTSYSFSIYTTWLRKKAFIVLTEVNSLDKHLSNVEIYMDSIHTTGISPTDECPWWYPDNIDLLLALCPSLVILF